MATPSNNVRDNAVAGSASHGFWYRMLNRPDSPAYDPNISPKKFYMGTFFNNTVHSSGGIGLWIFPGYTPSSPGWGNSIDEAPAVARFEYLTAWRNAKGAEWQESRNLQYRHFTLWDNSEAGIRTTRIQSDQDLNTIYGVTFANESIASMVADSVIIGNSDSSAPAAITSADLIYAKDSSHEGVRGVVVCATVCRARDAWFDTRRLSDNYIMCCELSVSRI